MPKLVSHRSDACWAILADWLSFRHTAGAYCLIYFSSQYCNYSNRSIEPYSALELLPAKYLKWRAQLLDMRHLLSAARSTRFHRQLRHFIKAASYTLIVTIVTNTGNAWAWRLAAYRPHFEPTAFHASHSRYFLCRGLRASHTLLYSHFIHQEADEEWWQS